MTEALVGAATEVIALPGGGHRATVGADDDSRFSYSPRRRASTT